MITSAEHFNRAITLWFELIGMDPNSESYDWGKRNLQQANDEIKESMTLDPTLVTAYLLLADISSWYFKKATMSIAEIDADEDYVFDYISKVREFKKLIKDVTILEAADTYREQLRKALVHIGCDGDAIGEFLSKDAYVAQVRNDALKSADRMRTDQFLTGEIDPPEVRPLYNPVMYSYWNVNSLVEHACSMPSGMSLNLVRDPDELQSYFAIALRNGGNLLLITDVPEYTHPFARQMSRRPDREHSRRVGKNWFPYDKLNIGYNEKGDPYHDKYRQSHEKGLVGHQPEFFEFAKLGELEIVTAAWLVQVFDLLVEKYWNQPFPQRQLSYTTEMLRLEDQNVLLSAAVNANLPITGYEPLRLAPLAVDDVRTGALTEKDVGKPYGNQKHNFGRNKWLEERYGHLVPEQALNLLAHGGVATEKPYLLSKPVEKGETWGRKDVPVRTDNAISHLPATEKGVNTTFGIKLPEGVRAYPVDAVNATNFGTREQIDADRKFIARSNFARGIQRAADDEFVRERPGILKWYRERVEANIDNVLRYACFPEGEHIEHKRPAGTRAFDANIETGEDWFGEKNVDAHKIWTGWDRYTFSRLIDIEAWTKEKGTDRLYEWGYMSDSQITLSNGWTQSRGGAYLCYFDDTRSTYALQVRPGCPEDLAEITGVPVDELPLFLRMWNPGMDDAYTGNSILDRIDPLEWRLQNPWHQLDFGVRVALSKRALARIRNRLTAPELPDMSDARSTGWVIRTGGHGNRSFADHSNWAEYDEDGIDQKHRRR
jgi:hypothetical protein